MGYRNPSISVFRNLLIVFGVLATAAFYMLRPEGVVGSYFSTTISVAALFAALFALRFLITTLGDGPQQLAFRMIFLGISCTVLGSVLWAFFIFSGMSDLASSVPPLLYFATYVLNFLGFLKLGINAKIKIRKFLGIVIGFSLFGLILLTISGASSGIEFNLIVLGYLVGDFLRIVLIALMLQMVIIYQGGLLGRYWLSIFIGNILIIIGNFSSAILFKEYSSGAWPFILIDLIFIGGYLFVTHGFYGIGDSIRSAQKKISQHGGKQ